MLDHETCVWTTEQWPFLELLTFSIHSFKEKDKVMTKEPASCLPFLSDLFYFEGRQFIDCLSFFSLGLSSSLQSFLVEGRVPSQVNGGSSEPPGEGGERMRTGKATLRIIEYTFN